MIELERVSFAYRDATGAAAAGVRDIDLRVEAGRCVLVCGASGCGKTTVTRLANGLASSFFPGELHGRVLVDGRDVAEMQSWEVAARVGSVFQNPRTQFFNVDSTGEVAFALESMAWPEERVRERTHETIAGLGIEGLADRSIFDLSGGEKQRIAYASAWAPRPANLVLDEPTSNLDMEAIADLRRYLLDAKARGAAVLVAEHRLWWLMDVADEVAFMEDGRIVRRMDAAEFRALPEDEAAAMGLRARDLGAVHATGRLRAGSRSAECLVRTENLRAGYRKREVLHGAGLSLAPGEVVALAGRNGAGKSTLARTLVGLHREEAGTIAIGGRAHAPKERLRRCAMVFQDVNHQLFADSVEVETTFGLEPDRAPAPDEVRAILESLGLLSVIDRHPATLSGGQKQRLAVAACIAAGTSLLVFDEPTSGLDLGSMRKVTTLVRRLADEDRSVLVVTHDLEFIAQACDRVLELADGRIVREAAVEGDLADARTLLAAAG